jgi:hypothetical protein
MMKCVGQESSTKLVKVKNVVLVNMLQWHQSLPLLVTTLYLFKEIFFYYMDYNSVENV